MKFFKILGIILILAGSCLCVFTDVPAADYTGIAITFLGAALEIVAAWKKSETKDWKVIVSICLFAVGGLLLGFMGFNESLVSTIITGVIGIVALIAGLFMTFKKE